MTSTGAWPPVLDLRDYLSILRLRIRTVVGVAALVLAAAAVVTVRQTPQYQSSTEVLVEPVQITQGDGNTVKVNMDTERQLADSPVVAALAARSLRSRLSPEALLESLTVKAATDTEILVFDYRDPSPSEAQRRVRAFASAYVSFRHQGALQDLRSAAQPIQARLDVLRAELDRVDGEIASTTSATERRTLQNQASAVVNQIADLQNRLSDLAPAESLQTGQVVAPATLPLSPVSPSYPRNLALALMLGLALGVGAAFIRERLDDRVRGVTDLETHVGAPVLAAVPRWNVHRAPYQELLMSEAEPYSPVSEAYRTLRTGLLFAANRGGIRTILVTSAGAAEGKTTTTARLGVALAHAGKRVVLVCADFRRPQLHRFFTLEEGEGLVNALAGELDVRRALIRPGIENLQFLPSGPLPASPDRMLGSDAMERVLSVLADDADVVLIDGTPVLGLADSLSLAPLVDAVLFVAADRRTTRRRVTEARQLLEQVSANVIGAVLNELDSPKSQLYPYYSHYGHRQPAPTVAPPATVGTLAVHRGAMDRRSQERGA
jgi:capsular exopolysaccharide synthesis family protein